MYGADVEAAVRRAAARYDADPHELHAAIDAESAAHLAQVLGIRLPAAQDHMAQVQRILTVHSDWGAGCKLLTDDVTTDLVAAIDAF
jgi:hypothetical protein